MTAAPPAIVQVYVGVACPRASSIACDRVGVAVELREPAATVSVAIGGRTLRLAAVPPRGSRRGTWFQGFLRPAGLTAAGPLHVRADGPGGWWVGRHPKRIAARLTVRLRDGTTASATWTGLLRPGWG